MRKYVKAWFTLEGAMLWLVPVVVLLLRAQGFIEPQIGENATNGWERILSYPGVSNMHIISSVAILLLMGIEYGVARKLCSVLGLVAVGVGLYSFWWPGVMATSFPLAIGGLLVAIKGISRAPKEGRRDSAS